MQENNFKFQINNYWRNIDKNILIGFILLFFLGIFFSFSSTSFLAGERLNKNYYFFFSKHLSYAVIAIFIMFYVSFINLNRLKNSILPLFIFSFFLLILVPIVGVEVKGSKRWLDLYLFRLQPIELIKPFFILVCAKILSLNKSNSLNTNYLFSFLLLSSILIFLMNQPDIGQSILLAGTWISIVFISGIKIIYLIIFSILIIFALTVILFFLPEKFNYIFVRLKSFIDPSKGDNFQTEKALEAIKLGGLKGRGMGEGILKDNVPEAHTDYIIAIITEEFGSIISILIILIFLYISFRIIKIATQQNDFNLKISLCGLCSLLIFQTFIHIGVNTSLLPTTGMTLPFLSYGGSSLVGSALLAGVILNYTKNRIDENE